MNGGTASLLAFVALGAIGVSAACGEPGVQTTDDNLHGKAATDDPALDAVGTISLLHETGSDELLCNAVLVAKSKVLTLARCVSTFDGETTTLLTRNGGTISFRIGADPAKPRSTYAVKTVTLAPLRRETHGFAILNLASEVSDATPIPLSETDLTNSDRGRTFAVAFYPQTLASLADGGAAIAAFAPRSQGEMVLRDLEEGRIRDGGVLEVSHELDATFSAKRGLGDNCHLEGAPVFARKAKGLELVGLAGSTTSESCSEIGVDPFGVLTRAFLQGNIEGCGAIPEDGRCEGNVAVRCIPPAEGGPRVTRINCAAIGLGCAVVNTKASCVDP